MKHFTTVHDVKNVDELIREALLLKQDPLAFRHIGRGRTLGLIFMNPSLRTRLSTQKAGMNLGMNVMVMNVDKEGWALEFNEGAVMNGTKVEHIKDAAAVMGSYCDIIGIRCFPGLVDRKEDYSEKVLLSFMKHCKVPVVSLESATLHPLQSLADLVTIKENWNKDRAPKVALTWAPHIKALPQAVSNSFAEWVLKTNAELVIAQPEGYELCEDYTRGAQIVHDQKAVLEGADFVYVKNWSGFHEYGKTLPVKGDWLLTNKKLSVTRNAKVMHCLPVRRNVELSDEVLDGKNSLVLKQAENRLFAAQAVLKQILEGHYKIQSKKFEHEATAYN